MIHFNLTKFFAYKTSVFTPYGSEEDSSVRKFLHKPYPFQ